MARDTETIGGGLKIWARFTLFMTLALTAVMVCAGFFLYTTATQVAHAGQERTLVESMALSAEAVGVDAESARLTAEHEVLSELVHDLESGAPESIAAWRESLLRRIDDNVTEHEALEPFWKQVGDTAFTHQGNTTSFAIEYGPEGQTGRLFQYRNPDRPDDPPYRVLQPDSPDRAASALLGLIIGTTILVILVGGGVALWVSNEVSRPLEALVQDVRHISAGDLKHRTISKGAAEITALARSIDRMTANLREARETEVELQIRQREVEVASEVREALLPKSTPRVAGYELGAVHLQSGELGGDFHDFIAVEGDGRVGLLVCDVSGKGLPGALVGSTARSYLRAELIAGRDVAQSFQLLNRQIVQDVRRGMYVTALYALLDPRQGIATVACAGHKLPLVRYTAADKKLRLVQPEGIALGFDKGPVFDRSLEIQRVPLEPGDSLVLVNTGAVSLTNEAGQELGEKAFYKQVLALAGEPAEHFLERLKGALTKYAGQRALPRDVSIVSVRRSP